MEITRLLSDVFDETQLLTALKDGFDILSPAHNNEPTSASIAFLT